MNYFHKPPNALYTAHLLPNPLIGSGNTFCLRETLDFRFAVDTRYFTGIGDVDRAERISFQWAATSANKDSEW